MKESVKRMKEMLEDIHLSLDEEEFFDEDFDWIYVEEQLARLKKLWLKEYTD